MYKPVPGSSIVRAVIVSPVIRPANVALLAIGGLSPLYTVTLALQLSLLLAAALAGALPLRPLLIARYYALTTASPAAGLWDWLRRGTSSRRMN